jgi:hypothetical protein
MIEPSPGQRPAAPTTPRPNATLIGCSWRESVCIHLVPPGKKIEQRFAADALTAAERAAAALRALDLPAPLPDGQLGGSPDFDVYLDPEGAGARAHDDPVTAMGPHDRASAFAIVGGRASASCALASDVARSMAQAMFIGLDASAHESTIAMGASHLATLIAPCHPVESDAVDRFQRRPELAFTRARADSFAGSFLFPAFLEDAYGKGKPGRLWPSLLALTSARAPAVAALWPGEPDVYDMLRKVFSGAGTSLEDALLGFAIARAFVGSRGDGAHIPDTERFGDLGRVRFDWSIELSTLPRRLILRPMEASGAAYLWLGLAGASDKDRLTVVADCAESYSFRWALVTVDAEGREIGRHTAGRWGEAKVHVTLEKLTGVAAAIVVGAAVGLDDRAAPLDPEDGLPPAAGCEVTLHRQ